MKKFIFFARVCICWTLAIPSTLCAQDSTDIYPNYVVIGAFAIHNNAIEFTKDANKNSFPAKFEMNLNRNLYYVYVLTTDDRKFAFSEALRLRKDTKYFDTWVYSGPFDKVPLAEQNAKEYRDFNPQTGEGIIAAKVPHHETKTNETIPGQAKNNQTVATNLDGATQEKTGRKNKKQERLSRKNRKDKGLNNNGPLNAENSGVEAGLASGTGPTDNGRTPRPEDETKPNDVAASEVVNGVATVESAGHDAAGSPERGKTSVVSANEPPSLTAARQSGAEPHEPISLTGSSEQKTTPTANASGSPSELAKQNAETVEDSRKGSDRRKLPASALATKDGSANPQTDGPTLRASEQSGNNKQIENETASRSGSLNTGQGEVKGQNSYLASTQKLQASESSPQRNSGNEQRSTQSSGQTPTQKTAREQSRGLTSAKEPTENKTVNNQVTKQGPGVKPTHTPAQASLEGKGKEHSLTSTQKSGSSASLSPDKSASDPTPTGQTTKPETAKGQDTKTGSAQNQKDNPKAGQQNVAKPQGQLVSDKGKAGGNGEQSGSIQSAGRQSPDVPANADTDDGTSATSGVKDLTAEELVKMNSLTQAGKKALLENRERVVKLGPPPQRATTAPLKKEEVVGKNFYFYLFRADNLATVDGEVDAIDFERSRKMATYRGNAPVKVIMPSGKTKQILFVCEVFGYRKQQKEFDPANPSEDLYLNDKGELVVPFELLRLQKGDIAIMYNVFFFKDAAVMRPESRYEVNNLLDLLVENPTYKVMIHGHTNGNATGKIIRMDTPDNFYSLTGTKHGFGSAKQLSEERAVVIRDFLVNSGISPDRMQIKAWGGKKPIHDKHSVRAHENVRVEIEIMSE